MKVGFMGICFLFIFPLYGQGISGIFNYPFLGEFEFSSEYPKGYSFTIGVYEGLLIIYNAKGKAKVVIRDKSGNWVVKGKYKGSKKVVKKLLIEVDPVSYETETDTIRVIYPMANGRWRFKGFSFDGMHSDHLLPVRAY